MTAPENNIVRGDLVHTTLSPPGVSIEREDLFKSLPTEIPRVQSDLLERFRLENTNLRRELKEAKADSVLQLNKASALWDKFRMDYQALQKEITEARKQVNELKRLLLIL